jgi:hypothetical protein
MAYSLVGNGYGVWSWGTTNDKDGVDTGMGYDTSCVLCGVCGDLSAGEEPHKYLCGENGIRSEASTLADFETGTWRVIGHGGACGPIVSDGTTSWYNNPVNAQAVCFLKSANLEGYWTPDYPAVSRIYETKPGRQCFLSGILGANGIWDNANSYARIRLVSIADATHPTPGWYVESNLKKSEWESNPMVKFLCVDFPVGHIFNYGTTVVKETTQTLKITTGTGVKACALTGIQGAFNVGSWYDGVFMNWPSAVGGDWFLTVTAGKSASWVCVR